jgi:2-oxoglutarate ferredoxin oxidoreductase subunit delta
MSEEAPAEQKTQILVKKEWCKSCGICVAVCPRHVLEMRDSYPVVVKLEDCTACEMCESHCPDFAICVVCGRRKLE